VNTPLARCLQQGVIAGDLAHASAHLDCYCSSSRFCWGMHLDCVLRAVSGSGRRRWWSFQTAVSPQRKAEHYHV